MSRPLYLHIGTHKTATTTVQRFFARNRDKLREMGIFYPSPEVVGAPGHYAHHRIAHAIAGQDDAMDFAGARAFFAKAAALASRDECIFISAEPFFRHRLAQTSDAVDDVEAGLRRYAQAVRAACGALDVRLLVMLRRQDLFIESMYGEHVLSTGYEGDILAFMEERRWMLDYDRRLAVWAEAFGIENLQVRLFERESLSAPIERMFVDWLGASWRDDLDLRGDFNAGLSRTFVEYKRRMNFASQPARVTNTLRAWLTRAAEMPFAADLPSRGRYYLTPRQRYDLMADFAAGNARVAKRNFGRDTLFLRPVEADARQYEGVEPLGAQEMERITKHLFRMIAQLD